MAEFSVNGLSTPQSPVLSSGTENEEVSVQPQVHMHNIRQGAFQVIIYLQKIGGRFTERLRMG